ncbi:MAG: hypothetical protein FJX25_10240 [Alphaproteobacteria bacterium]|nr:hypothetical protein [Alphaproteobacteria bacterium]
MTHPLITELVNAVAVAERNGATKGQRKAAFVAQAQLEAEIARLRGWLAEIDMRGKHYDGEDMADMAREALNGKPLEGVQP